MNCCSCNQPNDDDAAFCARCGRPLDPGPQAPPLKRSRAALWAVSLTAVFLFVLGLGYYKFFPPDGAVAVVNGEEIKESELDDEVARLGKAHESQNASAFAGAPGKAERNRLRAETLAGLIRERILLQEAHKAGISVSAGEVAAAVEGMRASSGMEKKQFERFVEARYGSHGEFRRAIEKRLRINRLIREKIAAGIRDPQMVQTAFAQWFREASRAAAVRVSLAEQWSGAGCGCCTGGGPAGRMQGTPVSAVVSDRGAAEGPAAVSNNDRPAAAAAAAAAGLSYWRAKYGNDAVSARTTDFGCHVQVDIVKDGKVLKSLRYQNGAITER